MKSYKTYRQFNKYRKQFFLGKDHYGNKLYPWDWVEIYLPGEMQTAWCSRIHWNALDGAFIQSHPGHKKMQLSYTRNLREMLEDYYGSGAKVKKITYNQFEDWEDEQTRKFIGDYDPAAEIQLLEVTI